MEDSKGCLNIFPARTSVQGSWWSRRLPKRAAASKIYIVSHHGFLGFGLIFFFELRPRFLSPVCPRFVHGLYTGRPRFVRAHLAPLVFRARPLFFRDLRPRSVPGPSPVCTRFVHGSYTVCPRSPGTLGFQSPASFFPWSPSPVRPRSVPGLYTVRPRFVHGLSALTWHPWFSEPGVFFFVISVPGPSPVCTRFVHGSSTVCPRSPGTLGCHIFSVFTSSTSSDPLASCGFWIEYFDTNPGGGIRKIEKHIFWQYVKKSVKRNRV